MKKVLQALLGCLGIKPKEKLLSPDEFTRLYLKRLQERCAGLTLEMREPLQLKAANAEGGESTVFLGNAYQLYESSPGQIETILEKYLKSTAETLQAKKESLDVNRIVPVIKDAQFINESIAGLKAKGFATDKFFQMYEPYNEELIILYAEDTATNMRYFTPEDLKEANLEMKDLRKIASENLRFLLPGIKLEGENGRYRITAGGDYDASLLLMDSLWTDGEIEVDGDYVIAIPSRDVLLVGGSNDVEGIKRMKKLVAEVAGEASYRISAKLFVYRQGKFEVFHPE